MQTAPSLIARRHANRYSEAILSGCGIDPADTPTTCRLCEPVFLGPEFAANVKEIT
jgi:hypothetical protein